MKQTITFAALLAAAGVAAPAVAQDSVSQLPGTFVGDAQVAWETAAQCSDFVVDLTPFTTSGGTRFGVAPLLKSRKSSDEFFSSLISAQSVSAGEVIADGFYADEYYFWNTPGAGVNFFDAGDGVPNSMGQLITPDATGEIYQFSAMFGEFAMTNADRDHNAVIGGLVQYDKDNPSRLYVSRNVISTNRIDSASFSTASLGVGTCDADGNFYFRADDNETGGGAIVGNNIFRVSLAGRDCDVVNQINQAGAADAAASDWILVNAPSVDPYSVPGNIPADVAGRPVYVGYNFLTQLARESAPLTVTADGSHLGGLATDHRGNMATYKADLLGSDGGVATGAVLSKSPGGGGATESISVYSMDADGNPVSGSQAIYPLPASPISDPIDAHTLSANGAYDHYRSQTAFRGGNAPCAIGTDADGNLLLLGVSYLNDAGNQDPFNAVIVTRVDGSGAVEHSLAGWVDAGVPTAVGKPVYGDSGNVIGELRPKFELDPAEPAPALSGAGFDGAGNVWFVGVVEYIEPDNGADNLQTTLLRAVYEPEVDGGGFGYRLEKVISFGDVIESQGTGLDYRIFGFQITDNDSVNSGTFWSSNVKQCTWGGIEPGQLESTADARSTAGVVVATSITYDVDMDGEFLLEEGSEDEAYNVLLYISNFEKAGDNCPADLDGNGSVGSGDLGILLAAWGSMGGAADLDGSGTVGSGDLGILLAAWGACP